MKTLKRITLVTVCISILYIILSEVLSFAELSLRAWVNVAGQVIMVLVTPLMLIALILMLLWRNTRVHRIIKLVCTMAAVIGYIFCGFYMFLFILFGTQEERMLTRHLLVTDESGFLDGSNYVYYRPVAFFLKTPGELKDTDKVEYLSKKYKRVFEVNESDDGLYDVEYPEVKVSVYLSGMELTDNYVDGMALSFLLKGYGELGLERDYDILNFGVEERDYMCVKINGESDISAAAGDISQLIVYATSREMTDEETYIYRENQGRIYYSFGNDENGYTGAIYFGNEDRKGREEIEAVIREEYQKAALQYAEKKVVSYVEDGIIYYPEDYTKTYQEELKIIFGENCKIGEKETVFVEGEECDCGSSSPGYQYDTWKVTYQDLSGMTFTQTIDNQHSLESLQLSWLKNQLAQYYEKKYLLGGFDEGTFEGLTGAERGRRTYCTVSIGIGGYSYTWDQKEEFDRIAEGGTRYYEGLMSAYRNKDTMLRLPEVNYEEIYSQFPVITKFHLCIDDKELSGEEKTVYEKAVQDKVYEMMEIIQKETSYTCNLCVQVNSAGGYQDMYDGARDWRYYILQGKEIEPEGEPNIAYCWAHAYAYEGIYW